MFAIEARVGPIFLMDTPLYVGYGVKLKKTRIIFSIINMLFKKNMSN